MPRGHLRSAKKKKKDRAIIGKERKKKEGKKGKKETRKRNNRKVNHHDKGVPIKCKQGLEKITSGMGVHFSTLLQGAKMTHWAPWVLTWMALMGTKSKSVHQRALAMA